MYTFREMNRLNAFCCTMKPDIQTFWVGLVVNICILAFNRILDNKHIKTFIKIFLLSFNKGPFIRLWNIVRAQNIQATFLSPTNPYQVCVSVLINILIVLKSIPCTMMVILGKRVKIWFQQLILILRIAILWQFSPKYTNRSLEPSTIRYIPRVGDVHYVVGLVMPNTYW